MGNCKHKILADFDEALHENKWNHATTKTMLSHYHTADISTQFQNHFPFKFSLLLSLEFRFNRFVFNFILFDIEKFKCILL